MTVEAGTDMKAEKLFTLHWSLIYKVMCAPKAWDAEKVSAQATADDPPGTSANRWVCSDPSTMDLPDDHPFKAGNPCVCNDDPDRRHWMVNC